jgi:hypothetical protein
MATFTDQIPQFNPYIQQLPVEAMVQVGMEKQKRYDEGLQKIQTQIETVAGLDVIKPLHKQYLQSRLGELGNRLKSVAAGDFSNFQLVNSVTGMTGQIAKDPIVQNAVQSTQFIRKEQARMDEAIKSGKSSPENEVWFNDELLNWQINPDLKTPFAGRYYEYVDVDKKLRDVASKIKEIEQSVDIPYVRDAKGEVLYFDKNGNITTPDKGNVRVDDAMLRIKVKGTPAEKILNNFYSSLNENDKRQLMITGNYHYRNATKDTFKKDIVDTYTTQKKQIEDQIVKMAVEIKTNNSLTAAEKTAMEAQIKAANDKLNSGYFEKEISKQIEQIDKSDIKDFKYRLYTQKYLTGLAQDLSNQSYTQEILSNPYAQMNMEKKKLAFQVERAKVEDSHFWANYGLSAQRLRFDIEKDMRDRAERERDRAALEPVVDYGGLGTSVKPPTLQDLDNNRKQTIANLNQLYIDNGKLLFPNLDPKNREQALGELVQKYINNPTSIKDNDERKFVEQARSLQLKLGQETGLYSQTMSMSSGYNSKINEIFRGAGGIVDRNGRQLVSAQDLYVLKNKLFEHVTITNVTGGDRPTPPVRKLDKEGYLKNVPENLRPYAIALAKEEMGEPLTNVERTIAKKADEVKDTYFPKVQQIYKEKKAVESKFLAQRMPEVQTTFGTLNMKDNTTAFRVENLIGNATRTYDELKSLDVTTPSDFNPQTIADWRSGNDAGKLIYVAEKAFDGSGKLIIYNGTQKQIIPMTANDVAAYFPKVAKTNFMTPIKYEILSSSGKTTNSNMRGDPTGAKMSGYEIPSLSATSYAPITRIDIEGDSDNNGGANDMFQVRMYVYDKGVWKNAVLNQQGYVSAAGVEEIMNEIGPATVLDVLRQK